MTVTLWRAFAGRAFAFWVALHAVSAVVKALAAAMSGIAPSSDGAASAVWMMAMTATLLSLDISRNRERLLLHDLGVRLRVLIPLVTIPAAVAELLYFALT